MNIPGSKMEDPASTGYIEHQLPFCSPFLCDAGPIKAGQYFNEVILWDCMPTECKNYLELFIALFCLLSVTTTVLNMVVLAANLLPRTRRILRRNPTMQNYSNYVISLSLADLLTGGVVMPMAAVFFHQEVSSPRVATTLNKSLIRDLMNDGNHFDSPKSFGYRVSLQNRTRLQTSNDVVPGDKIDQSDHLLHALGFFLHFSILVSVSTLAAASADRFYVSTKPSRKGGIRLSRVSLNRFNGNLLCRPVTCLTFDASRSTGIVMLIWMFALLFALIPLGIIKNSQYRQVGHVFVGVVINGQDPIAIIWYIGALASPLAITWVFSFLLCVVLRRRKKKLKKSSCNPLKHELRERRAVDKETDSSYAFVSRCSNTEIVTSVQPLTNSVSSEQTAVFKANCDPFIEVFSCGEEKVSKKTFRNLRLKPHLTPSSSLPCPRKRRPSSLDSSMIGGDMNEEEEMKENKLRPTCPKRVSMARSGEDTLPPGFVAKRILFRRSWEGPVSDVNKQSNITTSTTKDESNVPSKLTAATPPATPSPSSGRKVETGRCVRNAPNRSRRRSSIFRAREFITSNSFESNIARTLIAVIVMFTIAVLPLLIILSLMTQRDDDVSKDQRNRDVTSLVVTVSLLLSNSLWNCLIYGARMPYFRAAIVRFARRCIRPNENTSCASRLSRKLSRANSLRRNSEAGPSLL